MSKSRLSGIVFMAGVLIVLAAPAAFAQVPNILVDPLSMGSTQQVDTVVTLPLDITNTGGPDLTWSIVEDEGDVPGLVNWSDNFDSYPTGVQLHGVGGWKGWGNDPTYGALTSSVQARSVPNSVDIIGNSDLVHEYSGVSAGQWVYTAWQYIESSFTGTSYFILLNQYDDAGATNNWSVQVNFNGGTGMVTNDGTAGGTLPLMIDQWVEIRVEIDLVLDTQAFYYGNQLLFQGSWTDGMSGGGILNVGAVDLFANGATSIYYDDMSLARVVCTMPTDVPWLSVNPTAGVTPPMGTNVVDVAFDSTGMMVGTYTANLCIASNDPDPGPGNGTDLVIVPLSMILEIPVELMSFTVE